MSKLGVISQSQERLKIDGKLLLSANRKSHVLRRLAHQCIILSDRSVSRAISAVAELLVNCCCLSALLVSIYLSVCPQLSTT